MSKAAPDLDFREFRPTAVLVVDLVKHSKRRKSGIKAIQDVLISVFEDANRRLSLSGVRFNYVGDGYVVAFPGDASVRALDFINLAFPMLTQKLRVHQQQFRAGIDFGLVHLRGNSLTGSIEHFDLPGIQAARLESCAEADQILSSVTIYNLFSHHYPGMFGEQAIRVSAKDREMTAYVLQPTDLSDVRQYFENAILGKQDYRDTPVGIRKSILFVDDHTMVRQGVTEHLQRRLPSFQINAAADGAEALNIFEPGVYAVALTDISMPRVNGLELTERLTELDAELPIIAFTCHADSKLMSNFFAVGGTYYVTKDCEIEHLTRVILRTIATNISAIRNRLNVLNNNAGLFWLLLQQVIEGFNAILARAAESTDLASSLLRHKAKEIVFNFLDMVHPGNDVVSCLEQVLRQLQCVDRLLFAATRVSPSNIGGYWTAYAEDMRKLNPKLALAIECDIGNELAALPCTQILTLIFCELIDNAIAAVGGHGTIRATATLLPTAQVFQLTVCDSGPGVPAAIVQSMFDAGVSTKGSGRGLGLCLVKEAVSSLHGEIQYQYDEVAVFSVTVPLSKSRYIGPIPSPAVQGPLTHNAAPGS